MKRRQIVIGAGIIVIVGVLIAGAWYLYTQDRLPILDNREEGLSAEVVDPSPDEAAEQLPKLAANAPNDGASREELDAYYLELMFIASTAGECDDLKAATNDYERAINEKAPLSLVPVAECFYSKDKNSEEVKSNFDETQRRIRAVEDAAERRLLQQEFDDRRELMEARQ